MPPIRLALLVCLLAGCAHAQTKISAMPTASALAGTELVPIVQSGANAITTPSALLTYIQGVITVPAAHVTGNATPIAVQPAGTINTTSTTQVMAGIGSTAAFTPTGTGRVEVTVTGNAYISTAIAAITLQLYKGTGTAPTCCATAASGYTAYSTALQVKPQATGVTSGTAFTLTWIFTGLTVGTPIWADIGFATGTGADAANLANLQATIKEF